MYVGATDTGDEGEYEGEVGDAREALWAPLNCGLVGEYAGDVGLLGVSKVV